LNPIEAAFLPVYGLPCWNVRPGYGSFLTLEFGEPHLEVHEPRPSRAGASQRVNHFLARRHVFVHGEWHLWIYCCRWAVYRDGKRIGHSNLDGTSKRPIRRAAEELDGQKLVSVTVDPSRGASTFIFDLGARLDTEPYEAESVQWLLYQPDGRVLTYRADGCYRRHPGNLPSAEELWLSLPESEWQ
jgi:hypothetical protein